jgi:hypothetical protein
MEGLEWREGKGRRVSRPPLRLEGAGQVGGSRQRGHGGRAGAGRGKAPRQSQSRYKVNRSLAVLSGSRKGLGCDHKVMGTT